MTHEKDEQSLERRERRIDEALKETFPASDTPSFVGAGAAKPDEDKIRARKPRVKASEMAGRAIDQHADQSASPEEQESRKQRLLKGPAEFRDLRRDHPFKKLK